MPDTGSGHGWGRVRGAAKMPPGAEKRVLGKTLEKVGKTCYVCRGRLKMTRDIKEPEKRPLERIEQLLGRREKRGDQRTAERLPVEPGTEIYFPMVCKGEVVDISEAGLSVRFKPVESPSLEEGETIHLTIPLESHTFTIPATVRRLESRFNVVVLGMEFQPERIEVEEKDSEP